MSKERDLLRKVLEKTQYMSYECNNRIRNEIMEFLAQPEQEPLSDEGLEALAKYKFDKLWGLLPEDEVQGRIECI